MFTKLLKHEWRATKSILAVLCAIILISGLMMGFSLRSLALADGNEVVVTYSTMYVTGADDMQILEILCIIITTAGMFAIGFCCVGAVFAFISRFYKRCFTDEGYLTFTLPVTTHQILLSGIVNTVLGMTVVILAAVLGIGIIFGLFMTAITQEILWADVWISLGEAWQQIVASFWKNAGEFVMLGVSAVVGAFASLIELMLAVTIGALIAKKHKIIAAVGTFYGINVVLSMVNTFFALTATFSQNLSGLLGSTVLVSSAVIVGGYFLMHWLVDRKLNLP